MRTLSDVLTVSTQFLKEKEVMRPRFVVETLLAFVLQVKRLDLYLQFDRPLMEEELSQMRPLLKRAALGEPVDYILGEVSFCSMPFKVAPAVLIPRPETEILVELICKKLKEEPLEGKEAWDVCAGSGCMGIALKKRFPALKMSLSDCSKPALDCAQQNALKNEVSVECLLGHLLEPFEGRRADIVLCNPPYVAESEYCELDRSVRDFEPKLALVGGEDGLKFYRILKEVLPSFLYPGAKIFFEIGTGQGPLLLDLYSDPWWTVRRIEKDWSGHDRFFLLEFEPVIL